MKRSILSLVACFVCSLAWSQSWTPPNTANNINNANTGNVGIGVTQPSAKLEIVDAGNASLRVGVTSNMANTNAQILNSLAVLGFSSNYTSSCGAVAWDFYNNGNPSYAGTVIEHIGTGVTGNEYGLPAANQGRLLFENISSGVIATNGANIYISPVGNLTASFLANGSVGIGTTNTGANKLAVEGTIAARKVVVTLTSPFPDYVFDSAYRLAPLENVETYIRTHHHLSDVPSADSVAKNGIDVGSNQAVLLKKIEELTLYIIEQNKKVEMLTSRIQKLENNK